MKKLTDRTRASGSRRSSTHPLGIGIFLILILIAPGVSFGAVESYSDLLAAIRGVRAESQARIAQEKVRVAWETGKLINEYVLQNKERAEYGKQVIKRLAGDLGASDTELGYMLEFFRAYPIYPTSGELRWGQYRELLSVNDETERKLLAEQAALKQWSVKETRQAVKEAKALDNTPPQNVGGQAGVLESSKPGKPGAYRIILATAGPYLGELVIDLGFSNFYRLSVLTTPGMFKEGDIITSTQDEKGKYSLSPYGVRSTAKQKGSSPNAAPLTPDGALYTYNAYVFEVLDGDTVKAVIDLGFGITTTQTLRLRGIDAPEIVSREGKEAKAFLESVIANPEGVKQSDAQRHPEHSEGSQNGIAASSTKNRGGLLAMTAEPSVLIKTTKSDKYDRYLIDLFINKKYINQELVDQGHAVQVRG